MRKPVKQVLNDEARFRHWQENIPDFTFGGPVAISSALEDYLQCYQLLESAQSKQIKYYAGFVDIAGKRIFQQYFRQQAPAETVFVVHGYTDHAGIFSKVIKHLVCAGYSVAVFDQPGHGLSSGERASIESFDEYIAVFRNRFTCFQEHSQKKLHIVAQSMGGAIVLDCLSSADSPGIESGLGEVVLLAPLVRPKAWRQARWTMRFLSKFITSVPRGESENSEDEAFRYFVRHVDPVQHNRLPAAWVRAMLAWIEQFEARAGSHFPFWVIQGDHDETVDWQYNLAFISEHFPNAVVRMIPEAGHHLAGESDRLQKPLFAYLDAALQKQQA